MPHPSRRSDAELISLYDEVRRTAQTISDKFKETVGGDQYGWTGSMNDVENLRGALDDLDNAIIERMPDEDDADAINS
jgi:hypothetical protein